MGLTRGRIKILLGLVEWRALSYTIAMTYLGVRICRKYTETTFVEIYSLILRLGSLFVPLVFPFCAFKFNHDFFKTKNGCSVFSSFYLFEFREFFCCSWIKSIRRLMATPNLLAELANQASCCNHVGSNFPLKILTFPLILFPVWCGLLDSLNF